MAKKEIRLSCALAVYNEAENIGRCLASVKDIADEIVVVDGGSTDETVSIAHLYGATVIVTDNPPIFHINKQKALDACAGDWILQLDADEELTGQLAQEVRTVAEGGAVDWEKKAGPGKSRLLRRHMSILNKRDSGFGRKTDPVAGYLIPRRNYFLGGPITHAGTYPDGVVRLVKRGSAHFPSKSVHEQIEVRGCIQWLAGDLNHYSNPTLSRYWLGANRYIALLSAGIPRKNNGKPLGVFRYMIFLPVVTFFRLYVRHKGFLDGWRGFLFSVFSALHYPMAFIRSYEKQIGE